MAEPTVAEMLTNVRTAINNAILNGGVTRWSINDREQEVDLNFLQTVETNLIARQASSRSTGSLRSYVSFGGRPS